MPSSDEGSGEYLLFSNNNRRDRNNRTGAVARYNNSSYSSANRQHDRDEPQALGFTSHFNNLSIRDPNNEPGTSTGRRQSDNDESFQFGSGRFDQDCNCTPPSDDSDDSTRNSYRQADSSTELITRRTLIASTFAVTSDRLFDRDLAESGSSSQQTDFGQGFAQSRLPTQDFNQSFAQPRPPTQDFSQSFSELGSFSRDFAFSGGIIAQTISSSGSSISMQSSFASVSSDIRTFQQMNHGQAFQSGPPYQPGSAFEPGLAFQPVPVYPPDLVYPPRPSNQPDLDYNRCVPSSPEACNHDLMFRDTSVVNQRPVSAVSPAQSCNDSRQAELQIQNQLPLNFNYPSPSYQENSFGTRHQLNPSFDGQTIPGQSFDRKVPEPSFRMLGMHGNKRKYEPDYGDNTQSQSGRANDPSRDSAVGNRETGRPNRTTRIPTNSPRSTSTPIRRPRVIRTPGSSGNSNLLERMFRNRKARESFIAMFQTKSNPDENIRYGANSKSRNDNSGVSSIPDADMRDVSRQSSLFTPSNPSRSRTMHTSPPLAIRDQANLDNQVLDLSTAPSDIPVDLSVPIVIPDSDDMDDPLDLSVAHGPPSHP